MKHSATSLNTLYAGVLNTFQSGGELVSPRGMNTRERRGVHLVLEDPHDNVIDIPARNLNHGFGIAEWLWIMTGCALSDAILPFNRKLDIAMGAPTDHTMQGAYGPKWIEQLPYVIDTLLDDRSSRQAVVNIWRDRPRQSHDTPCTLSWQFFVRDEKLEMHTHMRANDVWRGLPYDIFNFTQIQRWLAATLYLPCGEYHHHVGSMHIYESDIPAAVKVLEAKSTWTGGGIPQQKMDLLNLPSLGLLQETLLSGARVKARVNEESCSEFDVMVWKHLYAELLSPYGAMWSTIPAILLSGNKTWRERLYQEGAYKDTPYYAVMGPRA